MDDIVFERDYTRHEEDADGQRANDIFEQAVQGGFFKAYSDAMDQIPKIIVQKDKENYEYLLARLDEYVQRWHGRIRGIVDYHKWESHIYVFMPFLAFESEDELDLLREISERAHTVTITPQDDGLRLNIMIGYFDELMTDEERECLTMDAIMQDELLAFMLEQLQSQDEQEYS